MSEKGAVEKVTVLHHPETGRFAHIKTQRVSTVAHKASIDEAGVPDFPPESLSKTPPKKTPEPVNAGEDKDKPPDEEWLKEFGKYKLEQVTGGSPLPKRARKTEDPENSGIFRSQPKGDRD